MEGQIQRVMQRYIKQRSGSQSHLGTVPDRQRTALKFRANFCCGFENGGGGSGGDENAVAAAGLSARPGDRAEQRGCDDDDILPDAALSAAAALVSALALA